MALLNEGQPDICHLQNTNICAILKTVPCRNKSLPKVTELAADTDVVLGHID